MKLKLSKSDMTSIVNILLLFILQWLQTLLVVIKNNILKNIERSIQRSIPFSKLYSLFILYVLLLYLKNTIMSDQKTPEFVLLKDEKILVRLAY